MLAGDWLEVVRATDPAIAEILAAEERRQEDGLELIASENFQSPAVRLAQASALQSKYAEGLPRKRYYGGCAEVDRAEELCIERAKQLFGAAYVCAQPHSGAQANMSVYIAVLSPGDKLMGMDLSHGGHLTHGHPLNFSGMTYQVHGYQVAKGSETIDYGALAAQAREVKPKLIVAGASAYPRILDFAAFRRIADEVGALLMVDMAHIAGLVAAGLHPNPVEHAHVVTTTTHKTLRGPRGGLIMTRDPELGARLDKALFPGVQGGPLMHTIAAKAVALHEAQLPGFRAYQQRVIENCRKLLASLVARGYRAVTGGTDVHLGLIDVGAKGISGKKAEGLLDAAGITVNKNTIPFDTRKPMVASGIRLGTPALTTRGMGLDHMERIAGWIASVLEGDDDPARLARIRDEVRQFARAFPLYQAA